MKNKVLITDRFSLSALTWLESQEHLEVKKTKNSHPTSDELKDAQALIIRSKTSINAELLEKAPNLKAIVTSTSGFDHIDFDATKIKGTKVFFTPEANAQSAAELTWALVLASAKKVNAAHSQVHKCDWDRKPLQGIELEGKTYGIIGLGRVGQRVAQMANAFGMDVIAHDPYASDEAFSTTSTQRVSIEEVLQTADVLSFHVPYTKETHHYLKKSTIERLKHGCLVINTSRGKVIREFDLIEALREGIIGAVGMDVFENEPLSKGSALLKLDNVTLTPHIGANTEEALNKASQIAAEKISDFFKNLEVSDELPPQEAWYISP